MVKGIFARSLDVVMWGCPPAKLSCHKLKDRDFVGGIKGVHDSSGDGFDFKLGRSVGLAPLGDILQESFCVSSDKLSGGGQPTHTCPSLSISRLAHTSSTSWFVKLPNVRNTCMKIYLQCSCNPETPTLGSQSLQLHQNCVLLPPELTHPEN